MTDKTARKSSDFRLYLRVIREARPYWPQLIASFGLDLFATPLLLLSPIPLKLAVDHVLGGMPLPGWASRLIPAGLQDSRTDLLLVAALLTVLVVVLSQARDMANNLLGTRAGERLVRGFRAKLFRHVQDLSLYFHDTRGSSDSLFRIQYDAPALQWITINGFLPFITATITFLTTIVVITRINLGLAIVALLVAPVLVAIFHTFRNPIRSGYKEVKGLESSAFNVVQEALGGIRVVKAFGRESNELVRFERHSDAGLAAKLDLAVKEGQFNLFTNLAIAAGGAAVLFFGARGVLAQTMTLGELLVVLSYLTQLYGPLKTISKTAGTLQSSLASADRAFQLLDEIPSVQDRPHARKLERARGEIALDGVSFSYDGKREVLRDISLRVPAGARLALVGKTGAGKTTLVSLMTRFYDPTAGTILLDGVDVRDIRLADLRRQFAVVLQEPLLFATSIAENIAYARPEASEEEMVAAARAAGAHDFIAALPDGYATLVGTRGMMLSGGERQRVSLARAFLRDAPILILDEPTSAVDVQTEQQILEAMDRLMAGRTTILIAHRASTIRGCDLIVQVEDGSALMKGRGEAGLLNALAGEPR